MLRDSFPLCFLCSPPFLSPSLCLPSDHTHAHNMGSKKRVSARSEIVHAQWGTRLFLKGWERRGEQEGTTCLEREGGAILAIFSFFWWQVPMMGSTLLLYSQTVTFSPPLVGQSAHNAPDTNNVALLDTITNTWITEFQPFGTASPDPDPAENTKLSLVAMLGITFVATVAIVTGLFFVLVRRRRRRTRNTVAREDLGDQSARSAVKRQETSEGHGLLKNAASFLGVGSKSKKGGSDSKRGSQSSLDIHPISVAARMSQLGTPATSLGYPEVTVQQGCGMVPVSSYMYPNQPCSVTEKDEDGLETKVVYHILSRAQQEALKSSQEDRVNNELHNVE